MATVTQVLDEDFKKAFQITEIHNLFQGGQKHVFIVTRNGSKQALKLFKNTFSNRDQRELKIYEKFRSLEGLPKIISVEKYENDAVVFEEYIEGDSLHKIATTFVGKGKEISNLLKKACNIMNPIWADRKVHRDLKPNNIMVRPNGEVVVIDFGVVLDMDGTIYTDVGFQPKSWDFSSPEQFLGNRDLIDYRSDFFSLGLIGFYLYHGRHPFANTEDELQKKYNDKLLNYNAESECILNPFFEGVFKYNPSERPRNLEKLLELLPQ